MFIQPVQVRKITFTGSTTVGKKLMAGAAGTVKKVFTVPKVQAIFQVMEI